MLSMIQLDYFFISQFMMINEMPTGEFVQLADFRRRDAESDELQGGMPSPLPWGVSVRGSPIQLFCCVPEVLMLDAATL